MRIFWKLVIIIFISVGGLNGWAEVTETRESLSTPRASVVRQTQHTPELRQWSDAGFGNPEIKEISVNQPAGNPFTHEFSLTMVLFRGTGWTEAQVRARLDRVVTIYSQCGIRVKKPKLIISDPVDGWLDVSYKQNIDKSIAERLPTAQRPVIFYMRSNMEGLTAYAWNRAKRGRKAVADTAWMMTDLNTEEYKKYRHPSYNEDAHELGHILGNCNHFDDGTRNFLSGTVRLLNDYIRPDQCKLIKSHELVREL